MLKCSEIDGNLIIANFLNLKQVKFPDEEKPLWVNKLFKEDFSDYGNYSDSSKFDYANTWPLSNILNFNNSWSDLMMVIDKIESINIRNNNIDFPKVKFLGDHVEIFIYSNFRGTSFYWKKWNDIQSNSWDHYTGQCSTKKEAAFQAVVEFLIWYKKHENI